MTIVSPEASLDPDQGKAGDVTHFWRVPRHHGLDCLRATFRRHAYARHSHDTYAIAGITAGCETFYHRGEQHYAGAGSIAVVCPDEVHDGKPFGDGFAYRTIYPSADLMREVAEEVTGRPVTRPPWFPGSVVWDPHLIVALTSLHASLHASSVTDRPWVSEMEQDTRLVDFLARFIARFADCERTEADPGGHHGIVRARDYIEVHLGDNIDLSGLAQVAGLSRSHFIRAFQRQTGFAPHAYLTDRRFRTASRLLGRGDPPGDVAAACGFFDQSHLNRVFKARMGVTPGVYRSP